MSLDHLSFWGKAQPAFAAPYPRLHPIAYHLLDVAATMEAILEARPLTLRRTARLLDMNESEAKHLLVALAGLHDIGKFSPGFQIKVPELWPEVLGSADRAGLSGGHHTEDGYCLWNDRLSSLLAERIWVGGGRALEILAPGVFGHHGRPVGGIAESRHRFSEPSVTAAVACATSIVDLLLPRPIESPPPLSSGLQIASWRIAGLVTIADWIGSGSGFHYAAVLKDDPSLAKYWKSARDQARRSVRVSGLAPPSPAPSRTFEQITGITGTGTPLQDWALTTELSDSPNLFIIEDVTGAGKTEAAQILIHRLMAHGSATGAYWGMPTQATANAMYSRQAGTLHALFDLDPTGPAPSLVLAHGQSANHEGFRNTVILEPGVVDLNDFSALQAGDEDVPATIACAAFLANDRRTALLADLGVGTIDQALLGILPSKFNVIRLSGLTEKVLVLDEVHAYDRYMGVELAQLLRFQAAMGGSAVLLSATLPSGQRDDLIEAWRDGVIEAEGSGWVRLPRVPPADVFPAVTIAAGTSVQVKALDAAPWSHRSLPVRMIQDPESAIEYVVDQARIGSAVAWIRNTVQDCLDAAAEVRTRGIEPIVFHARFAQIDRQTRETEVIERFGKAAPPEARKGAVLIATQVVEQSLDLDFDVMVTDIVPIDLLMQRSGRLRRHTRRDPERPVGTVAELVVLSPSPDDDPDENWLKGEFAGTASVYRNAGVLWRTVQQIAKVGRFDLPGGVRGLIEGVYASDETPRGLGRATDHAIGQDLAGAQQAMLASLNVTDGYNTLRNAWLSETRVQTRLGEEQTTLRLARRRDDGSLEAWASSTTPHRSWGLSEVKVSGKKVPWDSLSDPRHTLAVEQTRRGFGPFDQDIPILILEPFQEGWTGHLIRRDGKQVRFTYDIAIGLAFSINAE